MAFQPKPLTEPYVKLSLHTALLDRFIPQNHISNVQILLEMN
jgi:hypothetical protein